ncbi:hypothetical protein VC83_04158 [Pseudogymnoascus destructans]|uniref:Uncharacterized protein n=2 Tax=Pseudogymnoascus destructans TaxID=655981 RepID=L8FUT3_PSED2|nr:uncharacterized protein VC83_04158 [Pseudogymnoascus destructans]ELR04612.1 hypothetical protein GMDG_06894 [Pseudogymnoascus destructans 20631-21]OAF59156.1 hypothetical protein VC83_04158 [Pseudogymnoascus destructans]
MSVLHPDPLASSGLHNTQHIPPRSFYTSAALSASVPSNIDSNRPGRGEMFAEFAGRPYSSSGTSIPAGPRIPGPSRRKNLSEMIGITSEEEFERLPIAVRRKYFSTLERLRLSQNSSSAPSDLNLPVSRKRPVARRRLRKKSIAKSIPQPFTLSPTPQQLRGSRSKPVTAAEVAWFMSLPDKIRRKQFTKEEQLYFTSRRDSVILDAADEAIYKSSRRNRTVTPISQLPPSPTRLSMDSSIGSVMSERPTSIALAMEESFRWIDEDNDLDLRLVLDDYHANLPGTVIPDPASSVRPSFRRHISISKIPFGRSSLSPPARAASISGSSQPPPTPSRAPSRTLSRAASQSQSHTRQRSRAVSLISPRYTPESPRMPIDRYATHYQDPEARLKLRVYLASPQKFDEAIEFGFPSTDGVSDPSVEKKVIHPPNIRVTRDSAHTVRPAVLSPSPHTFFDDVGSLLDDDVSMPDLDSPLTPMDGSFQAPRASHGRLMSLGGSGADEFMHFGIRKPMLHKHTESYSLASAGSREMTLRMTLTRPDLRADEGTLYGWQWHGLGLGIKEKTKSQITLDSLPMEEKLPIMRGPLEGPDGWGLQDKDDSVVKRLWNRVRSGQRKTSTGSGY